MSLEAWGDCDIDFEDDLDPDVDYCGYCGDPIPVGVDAFDCCGRPVCVGAKIAREVEHGHSYGIVSRDDNGKVFEIRVSGVTGELTPDRMEAFAALGRAAIRHMEKSSGGYD